MTTNFYATATQKLWSKSFSWFTGLISPGSRLGAFLPRLSERQQAPEAEPDCGINPDWLELLRLHSELQVKEAYFAAEAGTGPMPYDRDWFETGCDLHALIEGAEDMNWYVANELLEITDWALASPQGKRAMALVDDPSNPEGETLSRLMELRNALIDKARAQLMAHGRRLQYSGETLNNLESYLYD